ncbi:MAG: hypothetical protein V4559_08350 [Pseudomonadota bacterium]
MAQGRKEMTSAEQLVELRKARDRYKALADSFRKEGDILADRFRDEGDPLIVMEEKLKRERDARRIANAYEKSIANIVASSTSMRRAQTSGPYAGSARIKLIVLIVVIAVAAVAFLAVGGGPETYRRVLAYFSSGSMNSAALPVSPSQAVRRTDDTPPTAVAPSAPPAAARRDQIAPQPAPVIAIAPPKKRRARANDETGVKPVPSSLDDGGFVAKVLQPDGTFKEQRFTAKPRR